MQQRLTSLIVVLILTGCSGYIPFSSNQLNGVVTQTPTSWSEVAAAKIIQLETQPEDPYSVNLWVIGMDAYLYVHAGDNLAAWVEHIQINPDVRLGYDGKIYELMATRVEDEDEFARFIPIYAEKYGNPPRNSNLSEIYLYRLASR